MSYYYSIWPDRSRSGIGYITIIEVRDHDDKDITERLDRLSKGDLHGIPFNGRTDDQIILQLRRYLARLMRKAFEDIDVDLID